jgi:hypothetical protein
MKLFFKISFIFIFIFITEYNYAQKSDIFVHNEKVYNTVDRWFSFGIGGSVNTELQEREVNFDAAFHQRVWKLYLQTGFHRCSDEFLYDKSLILSKSLQRMNDVYIGVGWRSSKLYSNVSIFTGPSYSYGSRFHHYDDIADTEFFEAYKTVGLYSNFNFTYKLSYDLGIGVSLYDSYTKYYHVYGFRFHLYFSGAFRKEI